MSTVSDFRSVFLPLGDSERAAKWPEWSIRMEAELIEKKLWKVVHVEVSLKKIVAAADGKKSAVMKTEEEIAEETEVLLVGRDSATMAEARARMIARVERSELAHFREERDPMVIWQKLMAVHQARGLATRLALRRRLLTSVKKDSESMQSWVTRVRDLAQDLREIGVQVPEEDEILALTMGLPASYEALVVSLDGMAAENISLGDVTQRMVNEEVRQVDQLTRARERTLLDEDDNPAPNAALAAGRGRASGTSGPDGCWRCGKLGHIRAFCTSEPFREGGRHTAGMAERVENVAF